MLLAICVLQQSKNVLGEHVDAAVDAGGHVRVGLFHVVQDRLVLADGDAAIVQGLLSRRLSGHHSDESSGIFLVKVEHLLERKVCADVAV